MPNYFAMRDDRNFTVADFEAGHPFEARRWQVPGFTGAKYFAFTLSVFEPEFTAIVLESAANQLITDHFLAEDILVVDGQPRHIWVATTRYYQQVSDHYIELRNGN